MRSTNQARFHCSYNITREKHHLFIKNPKRQPCLTWALTSNKLDVIDGHSTQEQSNQPEKDSIQDQNLNINDNKHEQHEQSTRAPGIINPTDEEVTKVDISSPRDDAVSQVHNNKHLQSGAIVINSKSEGNGVYLGMIPVEDQYITDNGKDIETPADKSIAITPTPD